MKTKRAYGYWESPISAEMLSGEKRLNDCKWAGDGETLVWAEGRGAQGVLCVKHRANAPRDISGDINVRGGVGYAGGEFDVHEMFAVFCGGDGRMYRVDVASGAPKAITPKYGSVATPTISPDGKWVVFVHTDGETDVLAVVDSHGLQWPRKIVVGADFYMQPAWSPSGDRLAWVSWDHPNMPWDGTRLETAPVEVDDRGLYLGKIEVWAGGPGTAVQQPTFSPNGKYLAYTSDKSGYSHIYNRDLSTGDVLRLTSGDADFAGPAWIQGLRHFDWALESTHVVAVRNERGKKSLVRVTVDCREVPIEPAAGYESVGQPTVSSLGHIAFFGSSSLVPGRLVTLLNGEDHRVDARSSNERVPPSELSPAQFVSWKFDDKKGEEIEVFANFYGPASTRFESDGRPPAIVMVHGGPTSQKTAAFEARNQFFATRGFAVMDVNYRGSTGYGRDYQDALYGEWGNVDVEDAVMAARYLVDADLADPDRLVIMGGSAGGYTVLQALTEHPGAFRAGVCMYGIANLFSLAHGTHKFESRYNDKLLGPLPAASELWKERSPIFKATNIEDAVAVYHGSKDKVVPIDQAEAIVGSLRSRGVPHVYHIYENEGHGWRRPENIKHFYESLLEFFQEHVLG